MSEWNVYRLGEISLMKYGSMPKKELIQEEGFPIYSGYGITGFYPKFNCENPEIIVIARGVGGTGDVKICPARCHVTNLSIIIRVDPSIVSKEYFFYKYQQYNLRFLDSGSAQSQITIDSLSNLNVELPALDKQQEVVKILSTLDRKIENLRKENETLEAIAQTLFKHWFVDFEFPDENGNPYKSSGGAMVRSELGEIPEGWRVGMLRDFGKVITGKTPSTKQSEYWGEYFPFVTPTDFKSYGKFILSSERKISEEAALKFRQLIIPENSVVVTCIGSDMGKVARTATQCITNQQLNSLIFGKIKNGVEYVYQFLLCQYKMLRLMALGGSTMPIINKTDFSSIEILIPDAMCLDQFNQVIEIINLKIINSEQQIQMLTRTRDTLLPKLMSGKLRIKA